MDDPAYCILFPELQQQGVVVVDVRASIRGWEKCFGNAPSKSGQVNGTIPKSVVLRFVDIRKIEIWTSISAPSATPRPVFLVLSAASTSSTGEPLSGGGGGGQTAVLPSLSKKEVVVVVDSGPASEPPTPLGARPRSPNHPPTLSHPHGQRANLVPGAKHGCFLLFFPDHMMVGR